MTDMTKSRSFRPGGASGFLSWIAVIQKLSGDVQVQKAGDSKQFKAFAKLSLKEGDRLVTGSKGSAVLHFANGASEDDKFTAGDFSLF